MEKKETIIQKTIIIEELAFKARHCIDKMEPDVERAKFYVNRMRDEQVLLEKALGIK